MFSHFNHSQPTSHKETLELKEVENLLELKVSIEKGTVTHQALEALSSKMWLTVIDTANDFTLSEWVLWKGSPQVCQWMLFLLQAKKIVCPAFFRVNKQGWSGWNLALRHQQHAAVIMPIFKLLLSQDKKALIKDLLRVDKGWSGWSLALRHQQNTTLITSIFDLLMTHAKQALTQDFFRVNQQGWSGWHIALQYQQDAPTIALFFKFLLLMNQADLLEELLRVTPNGCSVWHVALRHQQELTAIIPIFNFLLYGNGKKLVEDLLWINQQGWSGFHRALLYQKEKIVIAITRCLGVTAFQKEFQRANKQDHGSVPPDASLPYQTLRKTYPNGWSGRELLSCNPHFNTTSLHSLLTAAQSSIKISNDKKEEDLKINTVNQSAVSQSFKLPPLPKEKLLSATDKFSILLHSLNRKGYQFRLNCSKKKIAYLKITLSNQKTLLENQNKLQSNAQNLARELKVFLSANFPNIVWGTLNKEGELKNGSTATIQFIPSLYSIHLYVKNPVVIDQFIKWPVKAKQLLKKSAHQKPQYQSYGSATQSTARPESNHSNLNA